MMGDTSIKLEEGKTYKVKHCRKGVLTLRITEVDGPWVTGTIIEGTTKVLCIENQQSKGDMLVARATFMNVLEVLS